MSEVKVAGNRVTLPVACQLYAKEFEPSGQSKGFYCIVWVL